MTRTDLKQRAVNFVIWRAANKDAADVCAECPRPRLSDEAKAELRATRQREAAIQRLYGEAAMRASIRRRYHISRIRMYGMGW